MKQVVLFLSLVCLAGCSLNQDQRTAIGPFNKIKEFQVVLHAEVDRELLLSNVVDALKQVGSVEIAKASECMVDSTNASPSMVISVRGTRESAEGAIRVFGEVAVQPNQYKMVSQIWEAKDQNESLTYPVFENDKVTFETKKPATRNSDMSATVNRMVAQFAEQYRLDNPQGAKPSFQIFGQVL